MRPASTFLLAVLLLLLSPGVAGAAPGWSDPVRVTDDGTDSGPLLAPLPGGRVAIATAEQGGFPTPTPSEARIVQEADDGSFGAPQRIAGAFPLNGLFGGPSGRLTLLAAGAVFRGPADGPLAPVRGATYLPAVAQLPDGSAVAVYTDANALQAATAPPGGGFGDPVRIGPAGGDVHVAAAGDGTAVAVWTTADYAPAEVHAAWRRADGSWTVPQTVIPRQEMVSGPALALAAAGPGRAVLAADLGGVVRAAVSTDHRFSALTTFGGGGVATASVDAAGDAIIGFRPAPYTYSAPVSLSRLDAPSSLWGVPRPVGGCGTQVDTALDSHGTAVVALTEGSGFGVADRLTTALWPRGAELPEPQVLWRDDPAPALVALAVDDADRATIAFTGHDARGRGPLVVSRTAGSATDAAAAAPHDPRLAATNCTGAPGPPTPIADEPVAPATRMRVDRHVRLVHGRLVVSVECPTATNGCSGTVLVTARRVHYTSVATVAAAQGQWRKVSLPSTGRLRRAAKRTRLPVRVTVTSMLAGHESAVTRRTATL